MTFIDEELETLEKSPDYRRFLKVYIKYQMYTLCQKLADVGEESFVVTANISDGSFSHVGSSGGDNFLDKFNEIKWKFLSFCSSTDHIPEAYESRAPTDGTSPTGSQSESQVTVVDDDSDASQEPEYIEQQGGYTEQDTEYSQETEDTNSSGNGRMIYTTFNKHLPPDRENISGCFQLKHHSSSDHMSVTANSPGQNKPLSKDVDISKDSVWYGTPGMGQFRLGKKIKSEPEQFATDDSLVHEGFPSDDEEMEMSLDWSVNQRDENKCCQRNPIKFYCRLCDKVFLFQSRYVIHMRTHTGEKPYQCQVCEKSFAMSGNLTTHMRTHTGERPYQCQVCQKAFTQSCALTTHMKIHKVANNFQCSVCSKIFLNYKQLNEHLMLDHKEQEIKE